MSEEENRPKSVTAMWVMSRSATWVIAPIFGVMFVVIPTGLILSLTMASLGPIPIFAAVALMFLTIAAVMLESHSKVTVGTDGVLVRRRFGEHYIPFSDIAEAREVDGVAIRLTLHTGAMVDVYTAKDEQLGKPKYVRGCENLLARIREGVEAHRALEADGEGERRDALRDHAHRVLRAREPVQRVPYRAAPPPDPEELLRVVEAEGSPTTRAAAAVLVHQHGGQEAKRRIRVASEATAHPKLKRLFRVASADAQAEALELALSEVEQEDAGGNISHTDAGQVSARLIGD